MASKVSERLIEDLTACPESKPTAAVGARSESRSATSRYSSVYACVCMPVWVRPQCRQQRRRSGLLMPWTAGAQYSALRSCLKRSLHARS